MGGELSDLPPSGPLSGASPGPNCWPPSCCHADEDSEPATLSPEDSDEDSEVDSPPDRVTLLLSTAKSEEVVVGAEHSSETLPGTAGTEEHV